MSRIKAEEVLQLCAARFNIRVEDVKGLRAPGWWSRYPRLGPSRYEKAQCAALVLIDRHTSVASSYFLEVMGLSEYHDLKKIVATATEIVKSFEFEVSRIEESIDRIHELRISLEEADYDQVPSLRGKVFI